MDMKINEAEFRENLIKYKEIFIENIFKKTNIIETFNFKNYSIKLMFEYKVILYFEVDLKTKEYKNEENILNIFKDVFKNHTDIKFYENSKVIALYGDEYDFNLEIRKYKLKILEEYENR